MQQRLLFLRPTYLAAGICLAVMQHVSQPAWAQPKDAPKDVKEMTVVLDPGHGNPDLGARGLFSYEKDIVLSIAKKLGQKIVKAHPDIEIVYTRTIDTFIPLDDRGTIANRVNADLFISIHANANPKKAPSGTETYVMGLEKTDKNMDVAMSENAVILFEDNYEARYEGYDPNSPESFIMFSFMQNAHLEQSLSFASHVEDMFAHRFKRKSRGVKQGPFLVLWKTTMPSVLIETGFISNAEEEKYLNSEEGQNEIAEAILLALGEYKELWKKKRIAALQAASDNASKAQPAPPTTAKPTATPTTKPTTTPTTKPTVAPTTPPPAATTPSPAKPTTAGDRETYHVQIFSTSKQLKPNAREFKGLKSVSFYRYKAAYRYYVGSGSSPHDLAAQLKEVQKKFPDAFIVRLRNGKSDN
ncbi:MAG: N-acetylmuramoyl-L-alanine amidase [Prevotellaceae bacterium]|jgi:N-acetylmuramoyl-L-alanine amidase|nr:N-acetylmuramoyl-L-alanine amidase [Prevotellaceae bacterium]